jgi:hypothetical protein
LLVHSILNFVTVSSCRFLYACCAEGGQVAIFDATNTTKERRQQLVSCSSSSAAGSNRLLSLPPHCASLLTRAYADNVTYKLNPEKMLSHAGIPEPTCIFTPT